MDKPEISVIMAVYNGMPFLRGAVESILDQSYKNFEFIIVDDASKDKTLNYLKSINDKRITILKNRENFGLAGSLNICLKKVKGEYIARMDADDISMPNRLKEQINFLTNNQSIDICGTWADLIDEKGKKIGEKKYPTKNNDIKKGLAWYSPIIHPSMMIKKTVFDQLGGYNPVFDMAEDYELLMRAKKKYKMANIPKKLLKWRLWNDRRSRKNMNKIVKIDLKIKIEAFKRGDFNLFYLLIIAQKYFTTYLVPFRLKIKLAKLFKLA